MTKATLPKPHHHLIWTGNGGKFTAVTKPRIDSLDVYVGFQMEAYAADRVREALEDVKTILTGMYTEALKARVPEAEDEEGWNSHCLERALALTDATMKIRALIPQP